MKAENQTPVERLLPLFKRLRSLGLDQFPELEAEVSPAQVMLLEQIATYPGCGIQDISRNLNLTMPTISVGVSKLENYGLVKRQTDPGDKRSVQLYLTTEGLSYFDQFNTARQNKLHLLIKGLSTAEQETFLNLLERAVSFAEKNL
jgi:DNA-binding MarR family transcriptional regulator